MKPSELPTDPYLFRPLKKAFAALALVLLVGSLWLPAPLQDPAADERVPNPVKAAWFLVWVQELVSYSNLWIYALVVVGLGFFLLPFLPGVGQAERASWLPADQRLVNGLTLMTFTVIVLLTLVAIFFRGENWQFVLAF